MEVHEVVSNNSESIVKVYEVGPRDGLQNEAAFISTEDKLRLIHTLLELILIHNNEVDQYYSIIKLINP